MHAMQGTFNTREHGQEGGQFMHAMQGTLNTREHGQEGEEGAIDKTRGTAEAGMAAILGTNPNMYT